MSSRPPHTTACTRSRGGSCAIGMPRRIRSGRPRQAWREVRVLRDPAAFDAWLHRLLVNACHDHARRTRRRLVELPALPIDREEPRDDFAQLADRDEFSGPSSTFRRAPGGARPHPLRRPSGPRNRTRARDPAGDRLFTPPLRRASDARGPSRDPRARRSPPRSPDDGRVDGSRVDDWLPRTETGSREASSGRSPRRVASARSPGGPFSKVAPDATDMARTPSLRPILAIAIVGPADPGGRRHGLLRRFPASRVAAPSLRSGMARLSMRSLATCTSPMTCRAKHAR